MCLGFRAVSSDQQRAPEEDNPGLALVAHIGTELRHEADGSVTSWCRLRPDLAGADAALLPGCIAFVTDGSGGLATGLAVAPDWVVTSDLDLRLVGRVAAGPARTEARVVRRGRGSVTAVIRVVDEGDADRLVGTATLTSAVLTPEFEAPADHYPRGQRVTHGPAASAGPPLREWLGFAPVHWEERPGGVGAVGIDLRPELCNPWGVLHGGATCLLAEAAAENAAGTGPGSIRDLSVRFLAPARVGPVVAGAEVVGRRRGDAVVQVEVRDAGAGDRLVGLATVSVATHG